MNYTEIEGKVREATSDEAWGPTGQQMQELALATFTYEHFPEGINVRHKTRDLIDFIQDDEKLRDERKKAKKNKDKYIGAISEEPKERERNEDEDYEKEGDSDGDYGYRKPNKENVYRDSEAISSSPPRFGNFNNPSALSSVSNVERSISRAAASYGKAAATAAPRSTAVAASNSRELLDDLFKTCPAPSADADPTTHGLEDDFDPRCNPPGIEPGPSQ
ncbi:Liquid facets-Related [Operophtera brumata]|uniref:Liquid facets-Related n=1 Tax=Operophtera brumata TaxID=104452 RepID=A0A0L7LD46_OPEBR|nr:Liquid facets-Related [Operophtera brumata]